MVYNTFFGLIPLFFKKRKEIISNNSEFVSILIPVFNDGDILEKNLENLVKLNYPNYEILIIYSEKSKDRTKEVALTFSEKYKNIKAISENISKPNALNLGIDSAKGEYLLFLDSDTFIYNGFIERALSYFSDPKVKVVASSPLGLNSTQNFVTRLAWIILNFKNFIEIGTNKYLHHIKFNGFGAIWRKSALIEGDKFRIDSSIEDAEFNLRVNSKFPTWKGISDYELPCYQYFPTSFKSFYLQQLRWNLGNFKYDAKGIFRISGMGIRQKFFYSSIFLMATLFPIITLFSTGMSFVQFFANFFYPNIAFGGGLFIILLGAISVTISFIAMFIFIYSQYQKNSLVKLSWKFIIIGNLIMIYFLFLILGIVALNALKSLIIRKKAKDIYWKVDKSEIQYTSPD